MGMLAWVIMGLALWHYTILLPDRFWGGIVGAFLASIAGAIISGLVISAAAHGGSRSPAATPPHLATVLYAVPGAILGMALIYVVGAARETRGRAARRAATRVAGSVARAALVLGRGDAPSRRRCIEIPPLALETIEALERELGVQRCRSRRRWRAAGSPIPPRRAVFLDAAEAHQPARVPRHRRGGRARARARRARLDDHRARRLRLRRRLLHGDPGRRAARAGRGRRLAPARPPGGRLRARAGHRRAARSRAAPRC